MTKNAQPGGWRVSRRHMLQLAGATGIAGTFAAGCSKASEKGKSAGNTGRFQSAWPYTSPPKGHFNMLPGVADYVDIGYMDDLILTPGATYLWDEEKYYYLLADPSTSMSGDGKTLTYKLRRGLKWSDGKPVTAQDVYTTWTLLYIMGNAAFTYIDSFEKVDDHTVTFHFTEPAPIAEYYVLRSRIMSDAVYGKFMAAAEPLVKKGASSDDTAVAKLNKRISALRPKTVTASGPFNFDMSKVTSQSLSLVRNPSGYGVDKVNFDEIWVSGASTDSVVMPLILTGRIDYLTYGFPTANYKEFVSQGHFDFFYPPIYFGAALFMNYAKHPEFADKRVRQALAHAVDRAQEGAVAEGKEAGKAVTMMAGLSDVLVPKWVPAQDAAKLNHYDLDTAKAAQMLTDAGWKKSGKTWMTPQGKPASYEIIYPSQYADWAATAQNLQSQLGDFGIKLTLRGEDETIQPVDVDAGKFDLAIQSWGSSGNPFPTDSFSTDILTHNWPSTKPHRGMDFPLVQETESVGKIDFGKAIPESATGSVDEIKKKIGKLALAFNELLPIIPLYERYGNNPINTNNTTGWPHEGDPIYHNSIYGDNFVTILMYEGKLKHT